MISKRYYKRLIFIGDREDIFGNVKLNLVYIFRNFGADAEALFNNIFFSIYFRSAASSSDVPIP
jgi:hypothetical protein